MGKLSRSLIVVAGILSQSPCTGNLSLRPLYSDEDPRLAHLRKFFQEYDSPAYHLAGEFLLASDANSLDWRLLPAIALIESGGAKRYHRNNILGWANGRKKFKDLREGIHFVAHRLANSELYIDKDSEGVLRTYNTSEMYVRKVLALMETLGPPVIPAGDALN